MMKNTHDGSNISAQMMPLSQQTMATVAVLMTSAIHNSYVLLIAPVIMAKDVSLEMSGNNLTSPPSSPAPSTEPPQNSWADMPLLLAMVYVATLATRGTSFCFWEVIANRFGRRRILLIGLSISSFGMLLLGFSTTLEQTVLNRAIFGLLDPVSVVAKLTCVEISGQYYSQNLRRASAVALIVTSIVCGFFLHLETSHEVTANSRPLMTSSLILLVVTLIVLGLAYFLYPETLPGSGYDQIVQGRNYDLEGDAKTPTGKALFSISSSDPRLNDVPERFLIACSNNRIMAYKRWKSTCLWREVNNVDTILKVPSPKFFDIKHILPHSFHGHSLTRDVILYEKTGRIDLKQLHVSGIKAKDIEHHYVFLMEYIVKVLFDSPSSRVVVIFDMTGMRFQDLSPELITYAQSTITTLQAHYPELMSQFVIINVPFWFDILYKGISHIIDKRTSDKIALLKSRSSIQDSLKALVPAEDLPEEFGGSSRLKWGETQEEEDLVDYVNMNIRTAFGASVATAIRQPSQQNLFRRVSSPRSDEEDEFFDAVDSGGGAGDSDAAHPTKDMDKLSESGTFANSPKSQPQFMAAKSPAALIKYPTIDLDSATEADDALAHAPPVTLQSPSAIPVRRKDIFLYDAITWHNLKDVRFRKALVIYGTWAVSQHLLDWLYILWGINRYYKGDKTFSIQGICGSLFFCGATLFIFEAWRSPDLSRAVAGSPLSSCQAVNKIQLLLICCCFPTTAALGSSTISVGICWTLGLFGLVGKHLLWGFGVEGHNIILDSYDGESMGPRLQRMASTLELVGSATVTVLLCVMLIAASVWFEMRSSGIILSYLCVMSIQALSSMIDNSSGNARTSQSTASQETATVAAGAAD